MIPAEKPPLRSFFRPRGRGGPDAVSGKAEPEIALSGWGRYNTALCRVVRPEKIGALQEVVGKEPDGTLLARGAGRSYGDAALNPGGRTVLMGRLNRMLAFDKETGVLRCEAGVTLAEILEVFLPRGWFPAATPGTRFVTVGGSIACDVHGKNHHRDGSLSRSVRRLRVLLASGETVDCSREENADLFWATVGGMGLTGIILEVEIALRLVRTAWFRQLTVRANDLDEALSLFDRYEPDHQYSAAWIDCLARGEGLGRSVLFFGNHADPEDLDPASRAAPLSREAHTALRVPVAPPLSLVTTMTASAFNELYYRSFPNAPTPRLVDYESFLYPLDFLQDWNRLYGPRGFVQYQCVFPPETAREGLVRVLELCSRDGWGSSLAVLKRFGPQEGWLSFPMPGYTLAMDIPARAGLLSFLDQLDEQVTRHAGRVYLAKDARLPPDAFRAMYPAYPRWQEVKARVDPQNRFRSALADRLGIGA